MIKRHAVTNLIYALSILVINNILSNNSLAYAITMKIPIASDAFCI